jgi:hypothetical protein
MKFHDDWGGAFHFDNPYDVAGVPHDASLEEVEAALEELASAIRVLNLGEEVRRQVEAAATILRDPERRAELDGQQRTRLLAIQDPFSCFHRDGLPSEQIEDLLGGHQVQLIDLSRLSTLGLSPKPPGGRHGAR